MSDKISIIVPVFNEEKTVKEILSKVENVDLKKIKKEIIVVDDGSKDMTVSILKKNRNLYDKLIIHEKNYGKGMAVRTGLINSKGNIIIIQDADLEYNPENYADLLQPIISGRTKVVYGSRFLAKKYKKDHMPIQLHFVGNKLLSVIFSLIYFRWITDMETCYKVFKKDVMNDIKINSRSFDFEPEISSKIVKKGHRIIEVPIDYKPRTFEEGKKINWKDGLKAIITLVKYRFGD